MAGHGFGATNMLARRKYQGWTLGSTGLVLSNRSAKAGFYKIEFQEFKASHGRYSILQAGKKQDLTFKPFCTNQNKKAKSNEVSDLAFRNSLLRSKIYVLMNGAVIRSRS